MNIKADPALGVPYDNDLQFPGEFGKLYLYAVPEGHFRILELVWWDGAQRFTHVWIFVAEWYIWICGRFLFQEGSSMSVAVSSVLKAAE